MLTWPLPGNIGKTGNWPVRGDGTRRTQGFGSSRGDGTSRLHAACDLPAPPGTSVLAICPGRILSYTPRFFGATWAATVLHRAEGYEFIVRYGEIADPATSGGQKTEVAAGEQFAAVGPQARGTMLHFELYASNQDPRRVPLSIGGVWSQDRTQPRQENGRYPSRSPSSYTLEERRQIEAAGWHWDYQRRLDLADPTDFLVAIRDGRTPERPQPVGSHAPETAPVGTTVTFDESEVSVIGPSPEFQARATVRRMMDQLERSIPLEEMEELEAEAESVMGGVRPVGPCCGSRDRMRPRSMDIETPRHPEGGCDDGC